jgi:hypothetical protein
VSRNAWRGGERPKVRALVNELNAVLAAQRDAIEDQSDRNVPLTAP